MAPASASLLELNGRLRSGEVKTRDLVRSAAASLRALAAPEGPVRHVFEREAMQAAGAVERELKRGRTRGILQGAPFGVSELLQTAGRAPFWNPAIPPAQAEDAAAVSRLRGARAIPLAVLASPALGGVAQGFATSEAACAGLVSRGLLPFAVSLDFNGNVLRAALQQGCWALRPSFGMISGFGTAPLSWTLASVSVLARTPEDCGHAAAAMSGSDSRCPHSPGRAFRFAPEYARPPRELAVLGAGCPPSVRQAFQASGAAWSEAPVPGEDPTDILEVVLAAEAGEALQDELAESAQGREYLAQAQEIGAMDYLRAMRLRRALQDWLYQTLAGADAVVIPADLQEITGFAPGSGALAWFVTALLAGAPVIACGAGREQGLPAFCIAGRAGSENTLLRLAEAIRENPPKNPGD